jgi:Skp family chaperone for outer membrane proteins
MAFASMRKREHKPHEFYANLKSLGEERAMEDKERLNDFVSNMQHRSSPNSQRRANTLMKLAPRIATENKKYIMEKMYRKLSIEAENAVFGKPYSPKHGNNS